MKFLWTYIKHAIKIVAGKIILASTKPNTLRADMEDTQIFLGWKIVLL